MSELIFGNINDVNFAMLGIGDTLPPKTIDPEAKAEAQFRNDVSSINPEVANLQKQGYRLVGTVAEMQYQQEYVKNADKIKDRFADVKAVKVGDKPTKSGVMVAVLVKDKFIEPKAPTAPSDFTSKLPPQLQQVVGKFQALPKQKKMLVVGGGLAVVGVVAVLLIRRRNVNARRQS